MMENKSNEQVNTNNTIASTGYADDEVDEVFSHVKSKMLGDIYFSRKQNYVKATLSSPKNVFDDLVDGDFWVIHLYDLLSELCNVYPFVTAGKEKASLVNSQINIAGTHKNVHRALTFYVNMLNDIKRASDHYKQTIHIKAPSHRLSIGPPEKEMHSRLNVFKEGFIAALNKRLEKEKIGTSGLDAVRRAVVPGANKRNLSLCLYKDRISAQKEKRVFAPEIDYKIDELYGRLYSIEFVVPDIPELKGVA